ncbi:MAG: glycosyltransferase family A protein, partial [Parvibaculaceae bacterium]
MLIILAAAVALLSEAFELVAHVIHLRGVRIDRAPAGQKPTLILPLTGAAGGFERLIDCLNRQTQPFRRLIVAVESTGDPAHDRVQDLRARARFEIDLVIAGIGDTRGQKCTNIIAAVKSLAPEDRIVVFIDGDILPQDWWLATQITPLA